MGARTFEDRTIACSIYATAWDGDIVLEAWDNGVFLPVLQASAKP
jgi:hypothetical protein